jgi:hypothetical protein
LNFSGENGLTKGTAGRLIIGVLFCAWLNVAAQPCLMAMEPAPDTSHPSEITVHSEHNEHSSHTSDAPDCGHCPPGINDRGTWCETGSASDCEIFPGYNVDGRQFKQQAKDISPQLALFTVASTVDYSMAVTPLLAHST